MAYGAYYLPRLGYGTPATTLSYKECKDVPKMGVVRKTARKVVFGTAKYGDLGLDHPATIQN
jgi:hypothetical protein